MKKALIFRFALVIVTVMSICVLSAIMLISSTEQESRKNEMITSLGLICEIYEDEDSHDYELANRLSKIIGDARVSFIDSTGMVFVDT